MENLTLDKLSVLLSQRKLVCIDKVTKRGCYDVLRFVFDCGNERVISLLLTPEQTKDGLSITISFGH